MAGTAANSEYRGVGLGCAFSERHPNVAAVALANKTARMAWAMLRHETDYDPDFAIS